MAGTILDVSNIVHPHNMATEIANKYDTWRNLRGEWEEQKKEVVSYVYATDTTTTGNKTLPWANSTTTPKLTQIYDNLKANYEAALFPNTMWMKWQAKDRDPDNKKKAKAITSYLANKLERGKFRQVADTLLDDYILYGNCFATVEWVNEVNEKEDGTVSTGFVGPRIKRISPYDIVFNPTAADFKKTPKIIRSVIQLGELKGLGYEEDYQRLFAARREVAAARSTKKSDAFIADGFSSIEHYYGSGYVEVLTFYGDIYDDVNGEHKMRRKITVVDRAYILEDEEIASWLGDDPIFHAGWRSRPDNLYAMGPLDNLVGLQYRIDHLENLKADVFDQVAYPMMLVQGTVEDFDFTPGTRIYLGDDGAVSYLRPDVTALNADMQIRDLENKMEELAGAPRTAMGIRTPGEKTAFEVSSLQNAAGRIFQHKAAKFESEFIEPVLNSMLESAKRNMVSAESVPFTDTDIGATGFTTVTKEDIVASGHIVPRGARHFAERANRVQNLQQVAMMMQNPAVGPHISGKKIAEMMADLLNEPELYAENVAVNEQGKTQQTALDVEADGLEAMQVAAEEGL